MVKLVDFLLVQADKLWLSSVHADKSWYSYYIFEANRLKNYFGLSDYIILVTVPGFPTPTALIFC